MTGGGAAWATPQRVWASSIARNVHLRSEDMSYNEHYCRSERGFVRSVKEPSQAVLPPQLSALFGRVA